MTRLLVTVSALMLLGLVGCDAGGCPTLDDCPIRCEFGQSRGADGCSICACNPAPDPCASDGDCVLATPPGCCACERAFTRGQVDRDVCLVARGDESGTPPGCDPDPEMCAAVDCAACEAVVRATCVAGECVASSDCAVGDIPFEQRCVSGCTEHADCAVASRYDSSCCGGCSPVPRSVIETDACWAERRSESTCPGPAPGACDGLGCPSAPDDCAAFGGVAVCMEDGSCQLGGAGGECPGGTHEAGGVCAPD
ncbi:MAG: hypothetical protein AB7S26_10240 [Sandaracinaceae bacterium]